MLPVARIVCLLDSRVLGGLGSCAGCSRTIFITAGNVFLESMPQKAISRAPRGRVPYLVGEPGERLINDQFGNWSKLRHSPRYDVGPLAQILLDCLVDNGENRKLQLAS